MLSFPTRVADLLFLVCCTTAVCDGLEKTVVNALVSLDCDPFSTGQPLHRTIDGKCSYENVAADVK